MEKEIFCVGPIWNNAEAGRKTRKWLEENKPGQGWKFTGGWWSKKGTSYSRCSRILNCNKSNEDKPVSSVSYITTNMTGWIGFRIPTIEAYNKNHTCILSSREISVENKKDNNEKYKKFKEKLKDEKYKLEKTHEQKIKSFLKIEKS